MSDILGGSWAVFACSKNTGQHRSLSVQAHLEPVPVSTNHTIDVRLSFSIPSGIYLDIFELNARHDFGWERVFIHTYSNDVDYESVRALSGTHHVIVDFEFIGVPAVLSKGSQICDDAEDQTCKSDIDNGRYAVSVNFSLPLHFRYQFPIHCKDSALHGPGFVLESLQPPSIFMRVNNNTQQNFAEIAGANKRTHWVYSKTKLGNNGNYVSYLGVFPGLETYTMVDNEDAAVGMKGRDLTFRVPTGCIEDTDTVIFYTSYMMVASSLFLLIVMFARWRSK